MNVKNFIVLGIVAGIADFLLGWLFYGILFHDEMGGVNPDMTYITVGCFAFGFLFSLLFTRAGIASMASGVTSGALLGLFYSLASDSFMMAHEPYEMKMMLTDIAIMVVTGAIIGAILSAVHAKLNGASKT